MSNSEERIQETIELYNSDNIEEAVNIIRELYSSDEPNIKAQLLENETVVNIIIEWSERIAEEEKNNEEATT